MNKFITILTFLLCAAFAHADYMGKFEDNGRIKLPSHETFIFKNELVTNTDLDLKLTPYAFKSYIDGKFPLPALTRGLGLTGNNYNGVSVQAWGVDLPWLTEQIQTLTPKPRYALFHIDTSPTIAWNGSVKYDFFTTDAEVKLLTQSNAFSLWCSSVFDDRQNGYLNHTKRVVAMRIFFCCADILNVNPRMWIEFLPSKFSSIAEQAIWMSENPYPEINGIVFEIDTEGFLYDGTPIKNVLNFASAQNYLTYMRLDLGGLELSRYDNPKFRAAVPVFSFSKFEAQSLSCVSTASDSLANAAVLTGSWGVIIADNKTFTVESGEPSYCGYKSAWWQWTATKNGNVKFDFGARKYGRDGRVAVYRKTNPSGALAFANLTLCKYIDDPECLEFSAVENTTYYIAYGEYSPSSSGGKLKCNWNYTE